MDTRPRCHHAVVFPMDNCTTCMREHIASLETSLAEANQAYRSVREALGLASTDEENRLRAELAKWREEAEKQRLRAEAAENIKVMFTGAV